jgi:phage baseplate assembly protein W
MTNDQHLLTDIRIEVSQKDFRPLYRITNERRRGPGGQGYIMDLAVINGRDNLAQAIIMRLLTPRGELADLGHPQYGSSLHELVGRVNTETIWNLVRLYILESLQTEPRIEEVTEVKVRPTPHRRSSVDVSLQVLPIGKIDIVSVGPFTLEFG